MVPTVIRAARLGVTLLGIEKRPHPSDKGPARLSNWKQAARDSTCAVEPTNAELASDVRPSRCWRSRCLEQVESLDCPAMPLQPILPPRHSVQQKMCMRHAASHPAHSRIERVQTDSSREVVDRRLILSDPTLHPSAETPRLGQTGIEHDRALHHVGGCAEIINNKRESPSARSQRDRIIPTQFDCPLSKPFYLSQLSWSDRNPAIRFQAGIAGGGPAVGSCKFRVMIDRIIEEAQRLFVRRRLAN